LYFWENKPAGMKKVVLGALVCCLLFTDGIYAQIQPLTGNEINGMIIVDTDNYTTEMVWNYYNSDQAALLSEFGMVRLLVQKIQINGIGYKLEAYLMNSPEAAFGMYSLNILNCPGQDTITTWDCLTQYKYQSAYGRVYLIITNPDGTAAERAMNLDIARAFFQLNPQTPLVLPSVFSAPAFAGNRDQIDFIQGMNGMQNSLLPWQNLILKVRFAMYAVILPDPRGEIYFAQISFPTQTDMNLFLTRSNLMQNGMPVQAYWDNAFLFREFTPFDPQRPLTIYFIQCVQPVAIAEITAD
jgi:hypothetical protein